MKNNIAHYLEALLDDSKHFDSKTRMEIMARLQTILGEAAQLENLFAQQQPSENTDEPRPKAMEKAEQLTEKIVRDEVMSQVAQFSGIMTGYLQNLLTVMIPNVSLMKSQLSPDHDLQKHLLSMEKALAKTGALVKKFLNYNLDDIEKPHKIDLNRLVAGLVSGFQKRTKQDIEFKFSGGDDIPLLILYPKRIVQLLKMLTQNSLEALKGKGYIHFSTRLVNQHSDGFLPKKRFFLAKGNYVELAIEDNGYGISEAALPHIFKPFFSSKIKNHSAGLGLFVAYKIVTDLQGEIFVESEPGAHTAFYIYLPAHPQAEAITPEIPKNGHAAATDEPSTSVLIVDDEYHIRSVLSQVLESHGYHIFTAANGKEGVDLFQKEAPNIDLVLLDMVMPEMDGKTAFKEIRQIKSGQKIILMSGYSRREDLDEINRSGGEPLFMSKPFQVDAIIEKVDAALAQG